MFRFLIWLKDPGNRLWVKPALGSLAAVVVALLAAAASRFIPPTAVPDIERATLDGLLGVIASSMLVVATFSLSIMVAAFASAAVGASPRATNLVAGDADTQNAIATFISAFIYAVIANTALGLGLYGPAGRFVLFVSTIAVLIYVIATLVRWVKTLAMLGRMENTLAKIEKAATQAMRDHRRAPDMGARAGPDSTPEGQAVLAARVGYVRHIDMQALQDLAAQSAVRLHLRVRPGTLSYPGQVLAIVEGGGQVEHDTLREAFVVGSGRTFDQDPRFGLIVLCEVAQRALSPAVNDPGTAIAAMNTITRVLVDADPDEGSECADLDRLSLVPLDPADFVHQSFDPIARDGAGVPEVQLRMQKLLSIIADRCPGAVARAARAQATLSLQRALHGLALEHDRQRLGALHAELHPVAAGSP